MYFSAAVVLYGIVCISLAYVASHLDAILQAALSIFGIFGGPLVGLFTLGIIFPFANAIVCKELEKNIFKQLF